MIKFERMFFKSFSKPAIQPLSACCETPRVAPAGGSPGKKKEGGRRLKRIDLLTPF
jgi:hypothetical protein